MGTTAVNETTTYADGAKRRRRTPAQATGGRGQRALGAAMLAVIFAAMLRNGATPPVAWTLLSLATLALFAVQAVLDLRHGLAPPARAALLLALPYGAVLLWLCLQSVPGLPAALAHPSWELAPDGARPTISANPDAGRQVVMRLAAYAMIFWIALRGAGVSALAGGGMVRAIALFSTALALYGLFAWSTGYNLLLDTDESGQPLRASFVNRNSYATVAVFGVLANITAYIRALARVPSGSGLRGGLEVFFAGGWIFAFGALVGLGALALTLSRGGAVALMVGIAVLFWALRRGKRGVRAGFAQLSVPLGLVVFVGVTMTAGVLDRAGSVEGEARPALYGAALEGIAARPWLGHGAGAFAEAFRAHVPLELAAFDWDRAHSTYLENAFEFGLPAAAVFFAVFALIAAQLLRGVLTRRRNRSVPAFALACFAAGAVHAAVDFSLQIPANAALFAGILGIGWAQSFRSCAGEHRQVVRA